MEKLKKKYENLQNALGALETAIEQYKSVRKNRTVLPGFSFEDTLVMARNSVVQSFEFTIDVEWKYLRNYLEEKHTVVPDIKTPAVYIRECGRIGIVTPDEVSDLLEAIKARNSSSHIYDEEEIKRIVTQILKFHETMQTVADKLQP